MSKKGWPTKALINLADGLSEDAHLDAADDEGRSIDTQALLERAQRRAGAIRFAAARREMEHSQSTRKAGPSLSTRVLAQARAVLKKLAVAEPAFKEKYSIAFRNGASLPDEEVVQILEDLHRLGVNLDALVDD